MSIKRKRYIAKFTYEDIATYLGVSEQYLRQTVFRKKKKLKKLENLHALMNYIVARKALAAASEASLDKPADLC